MKRFLLILLLWPGLRAQQVSDVLKLVRDAYANLKTVHIVATRTDVVMMPGNTTWAPGGAASQGMAEFELAESPSGKYLARMKRTDGESLAVSDGSTTWKALPKQKRWAKIEASGAAGDEDAGAETEESAERPQDLHAELENMLIRRYVAMMTRAQGAELGKEENVKVAGAKIRCRIVRLVIGPVLNELWVDEKRGFVLQARETSRQQLGNGIGQVQITARVKELDVDAEVDNHLFSFEPERSWTEVDTLALPGEEQTVLIGKKAADFSLKSLDGAPVELAALRGKVVVLDFWATWCPPCRHELPVVDKLREEFGEDVRFLGINGEDNGTVKGFLRKNGYGLTMLMDPKRVVNRAYGVYAIPTIVVIDRDGVVRQHFIGGREAPELRRAIAAVLSSANPAPAEARP
jgi:peroxiredoxin